MTWRVWVGCRLAALAVGILLLVALFTVSPAEFIAEAPSLHMTVLVPADIKRAPVLVRPQKPLQSAESQPEAAKPELITPLPRAPVLSPVPQKANSVDRATPMIANSADSIATTPDATVSSRPAPRVASAPTGRSDVSSGTGASAQRTGPTRRLGASTLGLLRARECARLDARDRPADCPPNEELARLLAQERGPRYRPENAEAFSRNELAWRGIPPPCLKDGDNFEASGSSLCVRFGNVPSRVRSVREICEARGLGGCADAPSQAAINSALEQVRQQTAAKAP